MRQVWKQSEPESLTQERRDGNSFANLRKACKQAMQNALPQNILSLLRG